MFSYEVNSYHNLLGLTNKRLHASALLSCNSLRSCTDTMLLRSEHMISLPAQPAAWHQTLLSRRAFIEAHFRLISWRLMTCRPHLTQGAA
jgi:hypothetical protein